MSDESNQDSLRPPAEGPSDIESRELLLATLAQWEIVCLRCTLMAEEMNREHGRSG